jgi:hypothetical protein
MAKQFSCLAISLAWASIKHNVIKIRIGQHKNLGRFGIISSLFFQMIQSINIKRNKVQQRVNLTRKK